MPGGVSSESILHFKLKSCGGDMHKDLTWASQATSVKIPPQFHFSPGLNFYWHCRFMYIFSPLTCQNFMKQSPIADPFMRQCNQASSSFWLDCGGGDSEVSSSMSHCRTRLLAQQHNTIVFMCSCWHRYSFLSSLSYHDHMYISALTHSCALFQMLVIIIY